MKKVSITISTLLVALFLAGPSAANEKNDRREVPPTEVTLQTEGQAPFQNFHERAKLAPKQIKVKKLERKPRGRSAIDPAPAQKPWYDIGHL